MTASAQDLAAYWERQANRDPSDMACSAVELLDLPTSVNLLDEIADVIADRQLYGDSLFRLAVEVMERWT
jgi:hypothetical protein